MSLSVGAPIGFFTAICMGSRPPFRVQRVNDVTGAGDALVAGMVFAMLTNQTPDEAVRTTLAAVVLTVEGSTPVPSNIDQTTLFNRAGIPL